MSDQNAKHDVGKILFQLHDEIRSTASALPADLIQRLRVQLGEHLTPEALDSIEAKAKEICGVAMLKVDQQLGESRARLACLTNGERHGTT